ncbi:MAG: hypothetical protein VYE27_03145 [Pseudomonadota bacterium]|nr:hypothetical protein [Pseudomonadota bacterium]
MTIEWTFPLIGGALIGLALGLFIAYNNINRGIGSMLENVMEAHPSVSWNNQLLFIMGILVSPVIFSTFYPLQMIQLTENPFIIIISGVFVGLGCQLSGGGILHSMSIGLHHDRLYYLSRGLLIVLFAILTRTLFRNII